MTTKPRTIPDEHESLATLSAWLRCYPFMKYAPRKWGLHRVAISARCRALYPDVVRVLHEESRPHIINLPVSSQVEAIAA